ncbi:aldehyde dehydrogenase family protein [Sphingomonas aerolata]|uniref:aldehyde dehydrogenase family protein n=1 Tax=Sphingomonas aerolata TaxID=185951 RepID=UPI003360E9B2
MKKSEDVIDVNGDRYFYVRPALVEMAGQVACVREETFAPILYVLKYDALDEALALQNDVPQGLSSSIFATSIRDVERFLSAGGSDCGIANVNMGPSGAGSGARSAARRRRAAGARADRTRGRATCGARPTRSITAAACRWRKV